MALDTSAHNPAPASEYAGCDSSQSPNPILAWFSLCILALDRRLRQILKIVEFSDRRDCILRFADVRSRNHIRLADGSEIRRRDRLIELHFWNEHLSIGTGTGRSLGNAAGLRRLLRVSLELLGERMAVDHQYDEIRAIHARIVLNFRGREGKLESVAQHYGFEYAPSIPCLVQKCHDLLENLLIYGLIWGFNRPLLRQSVGRLSRADLWMSRSRFLALYGRPLLEESLPLESGFRRYREDAR